MFTHVQYVLYDTQNTYTILVGDKEVVAMAVVVVMTGGGVVVGMVMTGGSGVVGMVMTDGVWWWGWW